jgi:hypothetical protein
MSSDTISTRWVVLFGIALLIAFVLVATLDSPQIIVEQPIILPTPTVTETFTLAPSPAPTVTINPSNTGIRTVVIREPGSRTTVIVISPSPFPSPYPSPCDPTPVVGNC